jgi:hypothetical protein
MAAISRLVSLSVAAAALGCGGDDGGGGGLPDAGLDAPARVCDPVVPADLGTLADLEFRALIEPQPAGGAVYVDLFAQIDTGPKVDVVSIQLWEGLGVFAGGIAAGTYDLAGDDTDFYLCGACVLVAGDFDQVSMDIEQYLFAASGTLVLEEVSTMAGEMIRGSIADVELREVTLDDAAMAQTDVPGGCATSIEAASFEAMLQ